MAGEATVLTARKAARARVRHAESRATLGYFLDAHGSNRDGVVASDGTDTSAGAGGAGGAAAAGAAGAGAGGAGGSAAATAGALVGTPHPPLPACDPPRVMSPLDLGAGGSSPNDLERQNESFQRTQALLGASGVNWTPRRRVRGYTKDSGNKAVRAALWRMLRRCASTVDADRLVMVAYVHNG